MRTDPGTALLGASLAFAGTAVLGSVVAIRDQLPGEPLGVSIPLSVTAGATARPQRPALIAADGQ